MAAARGAAGWHGAEWQRWLMPGQGQQSDGRITCAEAAAGQWNKVMLAVTASRTAHGVAEQCRVVETRQQALIGREKRGCGISEQQEKKGSSVACF